MKSKLITIMGAPSCGKSTLSSDIHTYLKKLGKNSVYVQEAATDWIAENGTPNTPIEQIIIFYKQLGREQMFSGTKEYIICDSSGILNYFYFRNLFKPPLTNKDISIINHMQKEILKTIDNFSFIFYLPPNLENIKDGIRFQDEIEIIKIDNWIKNYLELENIPFIDLTKIKMEDRTNFVLEYILK